MSREVNPNGRASRGQAMEGVLRHPDGSLDIAAYAKLAHRERAAAVASSVREAVRMVREMMWGVRVSLAPTVRSGPPAGKHHAPARR